MNKVKQAALESAGWRFGDFGDFLDLTDAERRLVEFRVRVAVAIREARDRNRMTQAQLARAIKSTQPRVVKIEQGAAGVSLDQMLHAYFAAGGAAPEFATLKARPGVRTVIDTDEVIANIGGAKVPARKSSGMAKPSRGKGKAEKTTK